MPDLTVHDVPQEELDALAARAQRHARSLDAEVRHLIHDAASEELLVLELERATRAVEATLRGADAAAAPPQPGRRRYRSVEPTPRRR
jgi:plasmid stability protein